MDIVSRHGPESYDYRVLGEEFVRLGAKGRTALLKMMTSKNAEKALRAQQLLVNPNFRFTPDDQRLIASHWPKGDPQTLRPIMTRLYSPLMRRAALSTVSHPNKAIKALSLDILKAGEASLKPRLKTDPQAAFQPRPDLFLPLIKAVSNTPTAELINFLNTYPKEKTQSTFERALQNKNPEVIQAAFSALREVNQASAENVLFAQIKNTTDPKNALAITSLLNSDLSKVEKAKIKDALKPKLALIWGDFKRNPMEDKLAFLDTLKKFERSALSNKIYLEALSDPGNWRVSAQAARLISEYDIQAAIPTLSSFAKTHPIRDVRFEALKALDTLQKSKTTHASRLANINAQFPSCQFPNDDIRDYAKRMPFFDGLTFNNGKPVSRGNLTSATPTAKGWLAGYSRNSRLVSYSNAPSQMGVLAYYDNASGTPRALTSLPVQFVTPKAVPPLGQTTTEFWAFVSDPEDAQNDGKLFSVSGTKEGQFAVRLQAELPAKPIGFKRHADQSISIAFSETAYSPFKNPAHPALRLLPNGGILSACDSRTSPKTEAMR